MSAAKLVTIYGGSGFLGRQIARALAAEADLIMILTPDQAPVGSPRPARPGGEPAALVVEDRIFRALAVLRAVRPADLLAAMAYLTWPSLVAPVIAPFLGGVITDVLGWRWIFVLNVPIGVALAVGGALLILGGLGYYASSSRRRDEEQDATA